jgi:hypothetical protein
MRRAALTRTLRLAAPLLLLAALLLHERQVLAAATVQWTGFEKLADGYVAPSLSAGERAALHGAWLEARERVAGLYGPLRARPRVIVADARSYPRFASGTTGVTHYLPTGAAIILGPPGHNADVMAHELAHAELLARIGFRVLEACVPTWFDEGLAVQLDGRPAFGERVYFERLRSGWRMPPLKQLGTRAEFFRGTRDEVRFHYAAARVAVGQWLRALSPLEARGRIESIRCGGAWSARFARMADALPADE